MRDALVLMCSPHAGGVSDALGAAFADGLEEAGCSVCRLAVRDYPVLACTGCDACSRPPHACVLAERDDAEWLFSRFDSAPLVLLASPIYFYALPATFKAWIDRGQRFWAAKASMAGGGAAGSVPATGNGKPVLAVLAAGRPRGKELFSGALRTLTWFAVAMGAHLAENKVFRGVDRRGDLVARPEVLTEMRHWGRHWGGRLGVASKATRGAAPL